VGARIDEVHLLHDDRQLGFRLAAREGDLELLLAIFGRRSNVVLLDAARRVVAALRPLDETRPELSLGDAWSEPASRAPTAGSDRFAEVSDAQLLRAVESHYAEREREASREGLARRIERALRKEARSLDRKLEKIERTLAEAAQAARLERQGELLKGALSRVQRGEERIVVQDFATGEDVAIELDPRLSPSANLERLFKRYQKAVRSLTKAGAQQEEVRAARAAVAELEARLAATGESDVAAFAERPEVARLLSKYATRRSEPGAPPQRRREFKVGRFTVPPRLVPRRYRTAGDLEIWVGRSDEGNDLLSTRLARGKDLFFHLDGAPGSHVVLRTGGRDDPPSDAILDACELAVHYSKAKNATRADVHVVPIKNVKKPRGAKAGLVTVHGGKTIHLRRMQTRLERVLAAKIEDD
jgi:predicted ribosome quality control (RQC) complex YloA/Tae2 family protein